MQDETVSYQCVSLGAGGVSSEAASAPLQIVRLDNFMPSVPLSEDSRRLYTRRFATLFVDESRTKTGGNGTVISASNAFGERFALKTLGGSFDHEYEMHQTVSGIQGYPKLYGKAELNGEQAFVMEWVEGEDLSRVRKRLCVDDSGRLSPLTVARLGRDLFDVLARTSVLDDKVVHSDLSLRNVMVSTLGQSIEEQAENGVFDLRIVDFGSAVLEEEASKRTESGGIGAIAATPEFAAPELDQGKCTPAADVYAVSRILSMMLYGQDASSKVTAHADENDLSAVLLREPEVAVAIAQASSNFVPAPSVGEIRAAFEHVDEQLERILCYGLEADPAKRPSAAEMRDALASFSLSYATNIECALSGENLEPCDAPFANKGMERLSLGARNRIRIVGKSLSTGLLLAVILMTAYLIAATSISATWGDFTLDGAATELLAIALIALPAFGMLLRGKDDYRIGGLLRATLGILVLGALMAFVVNAGSYTSASFKQLMISAVFSASVMSWCPLVLDCAFPPRSASIKRRSRRAAALLAKGDAASLLGSGDGEPEDKERS